MAAVSLAGLFVFYPKSSYAANPNVISFQGKVVNADGSNVTNGTYPFNFILWTDPTAGTNVWQELSKSVIVTNGVFQTNLGSATALPDFNSYPALYLAIQFNNDAQGYMTPRIQLTSVPYAKNADELSGLTSASFGQLSAANTWTNTNLIKATSATAFQVQNSGNNGILTVDTNSNQVLLGTTGTGGIAGKLVFNSATAGNYTVSLVTSGSQSASYLLTLPVSAPSTSQCLQTDGSVSSQLVFAACATGGSGVTTVGALDGGTASSNGAYISGSTIYLQSASYTNPGLVNTTSQTFTGDKIFQSTTNSTTAFQVKNAQSQNVMQIDTSGSTDNSTNNLANNPSVETAPSSSNWIVKGTATIAQDGTTSDYGSYSLKITGAATNDGAFDKLNTTLTASTSYNLLFYVKSNNTTNATVQAGFSIDASTESVLCTNSIVVTISGWTRYSCSFTTPASGITSSNAIFIKTTDVTARTINVDGAYVQLSSSAASNYSEGNITLQGTITSPLIVQDNTNSNTAFVVQNASGGQVFAIDTTDTNLINNPANPSFEVNTAGWAVRYGGGTTTATIARDTSQQKYGIASLKITSVAQSGDGARYTLSSGSWAAGSYTVSFSLLNRVRLSPRFQLYTSAMARITTAAPLPQAQFRQQPAGSVMRLTVPSVAPPLP